MPPSGTLIANSHCHGPTDRIAAATLGPIAAGKVAKRNNEHQIELSRSWNAPMLSILPTVQTVPEMDVYEDEQAEAAPVFGGLRLVSV